jgi:ferredoxin
MDADARGLYNARLEGALTAARDRYSGKPLSKWIPTLKPAFAKNADPRESRAVFVDEISCIGCKQCVWHAPATFRIEPDHGRSRAYAQWLEAEPQLQSAIDSCPVSCIHWVERADLPALEHVMQNVLTERVNVGVMMAGQGRVVDVFDATASFLKQRRQREEAAARAAQQQRAYSPAQEAQRREAAREILRANLGFFAGMFEAATASMDQAVNGSAKGDASRVGFRRRPGGTGAAWAAAAAAAAAGASSGSSGWSTPSSPGGGTTPSRAATPASAATATGSVDDDWFMVPPERALVPVNSPRLQRELAAGVREALGGGGGGEASDSGGGGGESDGGGAPAARKTAPLKVAGMRARQSFEALFSRR